MIRSSKFKKEVAVVGCGIFGSMIALKLQEAGYSVSVFERLSQPLCGASYNNQNRLHLSFHYPRDIETARQCIRGFESFKRLFPEAINSGFPNGYFIAERGSLTSPEEYIKFCGQLSVPFEQIKVKDFPEKVINVSSAVLCNEVVYDSLILRKLIERKLKHAGINVYFDTEITSARNKGESIVLESNDGKERTYDMVINTTYSNINSISEWLGHAPKEFQYEYTVVPVIETPFTGDIGITIMDGPFMTVLPFGKTGRSLLYHVEHTVIDKRIQKTLPQEWLDKSTCPFNHLDGEAFFSKMKHECSKYVPRLDDSVLVGFLHGSRMVLANKDKTDERPSIIEKHQSNYITVFSGKIDHCVWVADEVLGLLSKQ